MTRGARLFVIRFRPTPMTHLWAFGVPRAFSWLVSRTFEKLQPLRARVPL